MAEDKSFTACPGREDSECRTKSKVENSKSKTLVKSKYFRSRIVPKVYRNSQDPGCPGFRKLNFHLDTISDYYPLPTSEPAELAHASHFTE